MIKLSLCELRLANFKNFCAQTLDLRHTPPGLYRVIGVDRTNPRLGSNGSGKSTLFADAPGWCLYGTTPSGLRTTEVQSWLTKKPAMVSITLTDGKTDWIVARGPRATDLTINGKAAAQDDVVNLVGLRPEAWSQTITWGQEQELFLDRSPAERLSLFSDALALDRWERRAEAALERAKRLKAALETVLGQLSGLEIALDHARAAQAGARDAATAWGREKAARLEKTASAAKSARFRAGSIEKERGEASLAAERAGLAAREVRGDADGLRAQLAELERAEATARADAHKWKAERARIERDLASFSKRVCPTCGQEVEAKNAKQHDQALRKQLVTAAANTNASANAADRNGRATAKLRPQLARLQEELAASEGSERAASGRQQLLERELATALAEAAAAERALADLEAESNPHHEAAQQARRRARQLEADIRVAEERRSKLERSVERAQFWTRGFREIRLMLIDDVLDDLRETTAEVVEELGVGDWEVSYATERETGQGTARRELAVDVRSPTAPRDKRVRWEVYSGGQRQRLRLAAASAFSAVLQAHAGVSLDFLVLDEPTRGMAPEGVMDLVESLREYSRSAGLRIFYIDHSAGDGLSFDGTFEVINEAGGARVSAR